MTKHYALSEEDELKPCPFCGSEAHWYPDGDMEGHQVMCSGKSAIFGGTAESCPTSTFGYESAEAAAKAWNTRAPVPQIPDGYALVPIEPTEEMEHAGNAKADVVAMRGNGKKYVHDMDMARYVYLAMVHQYRIDAAISAGKEK
jgi:hypothetical protein